MDGWLFTDFQGHDFITKEFLKLGNRFCTRRLFYLIPAQGEPVKVLTPDAKQPFEIQAAEVTVEGASTPDRKSTRLNSSHFH